MNPHYPSPHKAFLECFSDRFQNRLSTTDNPRKLWSCNKKWTQFMLSNDQTQPGVLREAAGIWAKRLGHDAYIPKKEWYTLDLVVVAPKYPEKKYWKSKALLTVEHENKKDVETEIWKQAHWRSDLAVLVFYEPAKAKQSWLSDKLSSLSEIVGRIDPNGLDRYLLIVGRPIGDTEVEFCSSVMEDSLFHDPIPFLTVELGETGT